MSDWYKSEGPGLVEIQRWCFMSFILLWKAHRQTASFSYRKWNCLKSLYKRVTFLSTHLLFCYLKFIVWFLNWDTGTNVNVKQATVKTGIISSERIIYLFSTNVPIVYLLSSKVCFWGGGLFVVAEMYCISSFCLKNNSKKYSASLHENRNNITNTYKYILNHRGSTEKKRQRQILIFAMQRVTQRMWGTI